MNKRVKIEGQPSNLYLAFFLMILGIVCAGVLGIVNEVTSPIIEKNEIEEVKKSLLSLGISDSEDVSDQYTLIKNVTNVYQGKNLNSETVYVFKTVNKNKYATVTVLVAINPLTKAIENTAVIGKSTSHGYDNEFTKDLGVNGYTVSDYDEHLINVSNATITRNTVKLSIQQAFEMLDIVLGGISHE